MEDPSSLSIKRVFFASDPQVDSLLPSTFVNGFQERLGSRANELDLYALLDWIVRSLITTKEDAFEDETKLMHIVRGTDDNETELESLSQLFEAELSVFRRNRIPFPYNIFCEFEWDDDLGYFRLESGEAMAIRVDTMASLLLEVELWQERQDNDQVSLFGEGLRWIFVFLGGWTEQGMPDGVVLVILEILKRQRVLDLPEAQSVKLTQLGPSGGEGQLFDDLAAVRMVWEEGGMIGMPRLARLRLWQSSFKSESKGCLVAMQAFYHGQDLEIPMEIHGKRTDAQFFTDVVLDKEEHILSISGYFVESRHGPTAGVFGALQFRTNTGMSHSAGKRESGTYFNIDLSQPIEEGFFATAFAGAVGPEKNINGLHLLMCSENLFLPHGTSLPSRHAPSAVTRQPDDKRNSVRIRPASSASENEQDHRFISGIPTSMRPESALAGEGGRFQVKQGGEASRGEGGEGGRFQVKQAEERSSVASGPRRPASAASMRNVDSSADVTRDLSMVRSFNDTNGRRTMSAVRDSRDSGRIPSVVPVVPSRPDSAATRRRTPVDWSRLSNPKESQIRTSAEEVGDASLSASETIQWKKDIVLLMQEGKLNAQSKLVFQVEYCTAERPTASLRGSTEQYVRVLEDLKERCHLAFWEYNTRVLGNCRFEGWASTREVQTRPVRPRIGACDIMLSWQHMSNIHHLPIHSKCQTRRWPNIEAICSEMLQMLPVQYHSVRFLLQNASTNGSIPSNAILELKVLQARDPLKLLGTCIEANADAEGLVSVSIPAGSYVATITHDIFETEAVPYELGPPEQGLYEPFKRVMLSSKLSPEQVKIVLYWDASPSDLDIFVVTPFTKVYHMRSLDPQSFCVLDGDVREGFGPETITIQKLNAERLSKIQADGRSSQAHVFVHQHSSDGHITSSGAVLQVLTESGIIHKAHVPRKGMGHYWDAFSIDLKDFSITIRDRITPSEPSFQILVGEGGDSNIVMSNSAVMGSDLKEAEDPQKKVRNILFNHQGFMSI